MKDEAESEEKSGAYSAKNVEADFINDAADDTITFTAITSNAADSFDETAASSNIIDAAADSIGAAAAFKEYGNAADSFEAASTNPPKGWRYKTLFTYTDKFIQAIVISVREYAKKVSNITYSP